MKKLTWLIALAVLALAPALCLGAAPTAVADVAGLVMERCTICHDSVRICQKLGKKSQKAWTAEIKEMVGKGANLSAKEQTQAAAYLAGLKPGAAPVCK